MTETCETMEEKLIEAVRSFPCLWKPKARSYKDVRAKENAWKEVASQVRETFPTLCPNLFI